MTSMRERAAKWQQLMEEAEETAEPLERAVSAYLAAAGDLPRGYARLIEVREAGLVVEYDDSYDVDTRQVTWDQLAADPAKVRDQREREQRRHERAQARADLERAKQRVAILDAAEQDR